MLDNPTIYPPGFPLLLAPFYKIFGLNFIVLKSLNVFLWFSAILLLYVYFKEKVNEKFACALAVFLSFSSVFFIFKQNVISDVAFFFFVCLCVFLIESPRHFIFLLLALSAAIWVRSTGAVLFVSAMLYFLVVEKSWKKSVIILLSMGVNMILLNAYIGYHPGFWSKIISDPHTYIISMFNNFATPFQGIWWFLCPGYTRLGAWLFHCVDLILKNVSMIIYMIISLFVFMCFRNLRIGFLEIFSFIYLSLFIFWSGFTMPPDAYVRFILPLLPSVFVVFYAMVRHWHFGRAILKLYFFILLFLNILNIYILKDFDDDVLFKSYNQSMFTWIKDNVKPEEHIMFFKPRALALLTGRIGSAPWVSVEQRDDFFKRISDLAITYVVLLKDGQQSTISQVIQRNEFIFVWQNERYVIFKHAKVSG